MSAGFFVSGSMSGATTRIIRMLTGESMYQGQLGMSNMIGGTGGHIQIADVASEALENDQPIIGVVSGIVDGSRAYSATYRGDGTTYTTTQATVAANGPSEVQVALIVPGDTLIRGPIFNAAFGTALTEITVTTASSGGVTITGANNAITDIADDFATAYCRKGANRGIYRIITTSTSTTANTVTIPFPYAISAGDIFVVASCVLGMGGLDIPATANCIDGNNDMDAYYPVFYTQIDLSVSGREWAEFYFHPKATWTAA